MEDSTTFSREWLVHVDILPSDVSELTPETLPADRTPALVYLAGMTRRSRRVMHDNLGVAVAILTMGLSTEFSPNTFPWWRLRFAHLHAVRAILIESRSASTGNGVLSALRGVLKTCWRLEMIDTNSYMRAVDVPGIKGEGLPQAAGRMLTGGELSALFAVCSVDPSPAGCRDACMLGLAAYAGLRRHEVAGLDLADWHPGGSREQGTLQVHGKGNKTRSVPLTSGLQDALVDWLHLRGRWPGPLFVAINKGGILGQSGLTEQAVYDLVEKRRIEAGVAEFSPHDLRRSFISNLLDAGADLAVVQRLAGHADAQTTSGYDRRGERAKADAVSRLHMIWQRRYSTTS